MLSQETLTRLEGRQQQLAELFLAESDPDAWPGMENSGDRGDRYWYKKNATATLAMVCRIQTLFQTLLRGHDEPPLPTEDDDLEQSIARAERAAAAVLERAQRTAKAR